MEDDKREGSDDGGDDRISKRLGLAAPVEPLEPPHVHLGSSPKTLAQHHLPKYETNTVVRITACHSRNDCGDFLQ